MAEITKSSDIKDLKKLGDQSTEYFIEPNISILEVFSAPSADFFTVEFVQEHNEFTSLCPKTGQPDYATFKILYRPSKVCIESKSLKLYLFSYRNSKGFGEAITNRIADDLQEVLEAKWITVIGNFSPRGGLGWNTKAIRTQYDSKLTDYEIQMIGNFC